ncbi:MAG: M48 family metallopeptidase [Planctomycetota bacterium]|jgi:Zn-dependent protease with chaperone function|nr:M48 family metallopeptidase [Planctomycetota bacterium]MDP7248051.1 M48 family metallopeptidase [Planctomycetota bacterium]
MPNPFTQEHPNEYEGGAFHPELPKGKASGTVKVSDTGVMFQCEHRTIQFSMIDLQVSVGGAADTMIFLKHPSHADVSIYTLDHGILDHPALVNDPHIGEHVKSIRRKKTVWWSVLAGIIVLAIGLIVLAWLAKSPLARIAASNVPPAWEEKLGETAFEQLKTTTLDLIEDPALDAEIAKLTDPLVKGIASQRYTFTFHITRNEQINAFAMPGGHVVIHTGLLLAADSPEEVAGVLAHEIAHVTHQHSLRKIFESAGLYIIVQAILGDASGLISVIADYGTFLVNRKFSRDFEREADDEGWVYLQRANIDPRGLAEFFKKIQQRKGGAIQTVEEATSILNTHPTDAERIGRLEKKWKAADRKDGFVEIEIDWKALKESGMLE